MNEFTASNGHKVTPNGDGANVYRGIMSTPIYPDEMQALREFFQAETDERLGRWRDPEQADFVVYGPFEPDEIGYDLIVVDEQTGERAQYRRSEDDGGGGKDFAHPWSNKHAWAARHWFAAHPEPEEYVIVWSGGLALTKPLTLPEAQAELKRAWDTGEIFRLVPLDVAGEEQ